jgi:hypothetical protein
MALGWPIAAGNGPPEARAARQTANVLCNNSNTRDFSVTDFYKLQA